MNSRQGQPNTAARQATALNIIVQNQDALRMAGSWLGSCSKTGQSEGNAFFYTWRRVKHDTQL
jgi:hypothetical protein